MGLHDMLFYVKIYPQPHTSVNSLFYHYSDLCFILRYKYIS